MKAARTGNPCTRVEYICDTYDAGRGLNLQADSGYIADYKVVENLRQAGPNVISEVTHKFIGYFFPLARFLTSHIPSVFLPPFYNASTFICAFFAAARLARGHVCRFGNVSEGFLGIPRSPRYKFRGDQL